jgi:hypothetical protein
VSDYLTALTGAGTAVAVGTVMMARSWPAWERKPLPKPAVRSVYVSLDELLDGPEVTNGDAWCPTEQRTRLHAVRHDGSRRCWTCSTESLAGAAS